MFNTLIIGLKHQVKVLAIKIKLTQCFFPFQMIILKNMANYKKLKPNGMNF